MKTKNTLHFTQEQVTKILADIAEEKDCLKYGSLLIIFCKVILMNVLQHFFFHIIFRYT